MVKYAALFVDTKRDKRNRTITLKALEKLAKMLPGTRITDGREEDPEGLGIIRSAWVEKETSLVGVAILTQAVRADVVVALDFALAGRPEEGKKGIKLPPKLQGAKIISRSYKAVKALIDAEDIIGVKAILTDRGVVEGAYLIEMDGESEEEEE